MEDGVILSSTDYVYITNYSNYSIFECYFTVFSGHCLDVIDHISLFTILWNRAITDYSLWHNLTHLIRITFWISWLVKPDVISASVNNN